MLFLLCVIFAVLFFTYTNGFHDTANSIATVVSTKVLTPKQAILLATVFNLLGALAGTAVAVTVGKGMVDPEYVTMTTVFCAMLSAIVWNLLTWYYGIPSSSSQGLIGGLIGAVVASAQGHWSAVIWSTPNHRHWWESGGVFYKVILPMLTSPICGFIVGGLVMSSLYFGLHRFSPRTVNRLFGKLQLISASYMGYSHGTNDAQKSMGILALALFSATKAGALDHLPRPLHFLYTPEFEIGVSIQILCGLTMALGTAVGGWRIIRTLGHKLVKLHPVHGFAAETTGATILLVTAKLGMPVSTTHAITASIIGVGSAKNWRAIKLPIVETILWAWILTLPATAALAYLLVRAAEWVVS
jgi:PiT family inorganic phosphate transporter